MLETIVVLCILVIIVGVFVFDLWLSILNYKNRFAKIPDEVSDVYNEIEYNQWLKYYMENFKFGLVIKVVGVIITLLLLGTGAFVLFDKIAEEITSYLPLQTTIFMGFYFFVLFIADICTSYYDTFYIEQKHGFNKQTKKIFYIDKIKSFILTSIFGGGIVFLISVVYGLPKIQFFIYLWFSLVFIVLIVNIIYVPVIIPIFNKLIPLQEGSLKDKITTFSTSVGYKVKRISVMNASKRSTKVNAFFSGFGKCKHIVLYDTLIEEFSEEEVVAVLAHEIGHSKHKHGMINIFQTAIVITVFIGIFIVVSSFDIFSVAFGFDHASFGFSIIVFMILFQPIGVLLGFIQSVLSRRHEYQADAFAASNYSRQYMEQSLKRIAKLNFVNLTPHPLYVSLRYSHPPIFLRIREIRKL